MNDKCVYRKLQLLLQVTTGISCHFTAVDGIIHFSFIPFFLLSYFMNQGGVVILRAKVKVDAGEQKENESREERERIQ